MAPHPGKPSGREIYCLRGTTGGRLFPSGRPWASLLAGKPYRGAARLKPWEIFLEPPWDCGRRGNLPPGGPGGNLHRGGRHPFLGALGENGTNSPAKTPPGGPPPSGEARITSANYPLGPGRAPSALCGPKLAALGHEEFPPQQHTPSAGAQPPSTSTRAPQATSPPSAAL